MIEPLKRATLVVAVFGVIGLGIGLTAYFPISYLTNTFSGGFMGPILSALIGLQTVLLVVFVAPVVAGLAGLLSGYTDPNPLTGAATAGVGSFIGFYVMLLLAGLLVAGGFAGLPGDGAPADTPTPYSTEHQFTVPPDYETETPGDIAIDIETPTPARPLETAQSGLDAILVGGFPAALVGALTAVIGYWFRARA